MTKQFDRCRINIYIFYICRILLALDVRQERFEAVVQSQRFQMDVQHQRTEAECMGRLEHAGEERDEVE